MIVTPLPRRPLVSLPTRTTAGFFAGSLLPLTFASRERLTALYTYIVNDFERSRWSGFATQDETGRQIHDLSFDQGQHTKSILDMPEFNLLDPGWKSLLKQRKMLGLLQRDDPISAVKICRCCLNRVSR